MAVEAQITGKVQFRQGDGANLTIRPGPVQVTITLTDATLSWEDGDTHANAAMPIGDFRNYVAQGQIELPPGAEEAEEAALTQASPAHS